VLPDKLGSTSLNAIGACALVVGSTDDWVVLGCATMDISTVLGTLDVVVGSTSLNATLCGSVAGLDEEGRAVLACTDEMDGSVLATRLLSADDCGEPVSLGTLLVALELGAAGSDVGVEMAVVTAAMLAISMRGFGGSNQKFQTRESSSWHCAHSDAMSRTIVGTAMFGLTSSQIVLH